ncbi:hypothetical protein GS886_26295 [Rhodococcus hoagii]|nr:hypothetical protein [Prescottella equi]
MDEGPRPQLGQPDLRGRRAGRLRHRLGGYASSIVTGLAFRIEGSGKRKGEQTTGFVDDPGQSFLRQKGRKTGADNIISARIYRRDDLPDAYQARRPSVDRLGGR